MKYLVRREDGKLVEADQRHRVDNVIDVAWVDLIPTDRVVEYSDLYNLATLPIIDENPCGNPIHALINERGIKMRADYAVVEQKRKSGRQDIVDVTFLKKK